MIDGRKRARKISKDDRLRIDELDAQGMSIADIAQTIELSGNQVSGYINAKRRGNVVPWSTKNLPGGVAPAPPPPDATLPLSETPPMSQAPSRPPAPPPSFHGFEVIGSAQGAHGGFTLPQQQQPSFRVERLNPPDGFLGSHLGEFSPEDLGRTYGEGHYRITILVPGRPPLLSEPRISSAFGEPRIPRRIESKDTRSDPGAQARAAGYPNNMQTQQSFPFGQFGRPATYPVPGADTATTEAIRQMGELQKEVLKQKGNPEEGVRTMYQQQNDTFLRMRDEERKREDDRRNDEQKRFENQLELSDRRHRQDLERQEKEGDHREKRIQDDRKSSLDLEKQRTDFILGQSKEREENAQKETAKIREEMGSLKESLKEELEEDRARFDKEIDLRRDHLNKEHELRLENIKLKEEVATSGSGEQIFKSAEKIVQEIGKHVNSVLEYKKTELAANHSAGNVTEMRDEARRKAEPEEEQPAPQPEETESMEDKIRALLQDPSVKSIISEWATQVEAKAKPGSFVNLFLEGIRDVDDGRLRKGCNTLVVAMRTRDWPTILEILSPGLDEKTLATFQTEYAAEFFGYFRKCVLTSVDEWWEEVLQTSRYGNSPAEDAKATEPTEGEPAATETAPVETAPPEGAPKAAPEKTAAQ